MLKWELVWELHFADAGLSDHNSIQYPVLVVLRLDISNICYVTFQHTEHLSSNITNYLIIHQDLLAHYRITNELS